ncbi:tRNA-binding protein [Flavobacteriaceae bacterium]|nr:tRNA-binding protein [Flavobacteriaceae bacterium]
MDFDHWQKVDLRVGEIIEVKDFPNARKPAYQLWIDFGPLGVKKSSAQITALYNPENLIGRKIIAVVNFPKKQIANFMSECLVLGYYNDSNHVVLASVSQTALLGSPIN